MKLKFLFRGFSDYESSSPKRTWFIWISAEDAFEDILLYKIDRTKPNMKEPYFWIKYEVKKL